MENFLIRKSFITIYRTMSLLIYSLPLLLVSPFAILGVQFLGHLEPLVPFPWIAYGIQSYSISSQRINYKTINWANVSLALLLIFTQNLMFIQYPAIHQIWLRQISTFS